MEDWYCFKCKEKMVEKDIKSSYLDLEAEVKGLQCPKCKTAYLSEKTTMEVVKKGEEEWEAKTG